MQQYAVETARFDSKEARSRLETVIAQDSRFRSFDATRLADHVLRCREAAAVLDLEDPVLKKNGERRPLSW